MHMGDAPICTLIFKLTQNLNFLNLLKNNTFFKTISS